MSTKPKAKKTVARKKTMRVKQQPDASLVEVDLPVSAEEQLTVATEADTLVEEPSAAAEVPLPDPVPEAAAVVEEEVEEPVADSPVAPLVFRLSSSAHAFLRRLVASYLGAREFTDEVRRSLRQALMAGNQVVIVEGEAGQPRYSVRTLTVAFDEKDPASDTKAICHVNRRAWEAKVLRRA